MEGGADRGEKYSGRCVAVGSWVPPELQLEPGEGGAKSREGSEIAATDFAEVEVAEGGLIIGGEVGSEGVDVLRLQETKGLESRGRGGKDRAKGFVSDHVKEIEGERGEGEGAGEERRGAGIDVDISVQEEGFQVWGDKRSALAQVRME